MKHAPVKLPDADAPAPLPAVRNRAAGIVNRLSSFALAWDIDNRLSAKTHDNQALGTADYQYDVLGRRVAKDSGGFVGKTVTLWWNMREVADYETTGTTPGPNITEKFYTENNPDNFTVAGHGGEVSISDQSEGDWIPAESKDQMNTVDGEINLDAEALAEIIREHEHWSPEKIVVLYSCNTGNRPGIARMAPFAQNLADELGVPIIAPDKDVLFFNDEPSRVERGGNWLRFEPGGNGVGVPVKQPIQ